MSMATIEEAREYARKGMSLCMDSSDEKDIYCEDLAQAYLAGGESTQKALTAHYETEIARYKHALTESAIREKIAYEIVEDRRKEIARLTKWNDPGDGFNGYGRKVLIKMVHNEEEIIQIARYIDVESQWLFALNNHPVPIDVIGWREIHE